MSSIKIDLDLLEKEKIIDASTRLTIELWHKNHGKNETGKNIISIFSILGAITMGLGILLFFSANWDNMSDLMKTLVILTGIIGFYLAGWYYTYRKTGFEKTGQALILIGAITYGAGIFLLGQIYNIGGTFSLSLLLWMFGVIPVAYITRFSTLFILSIGLLTGYLLTVLEDHHNSLSLFQYFLIVISTGYFLLSLVRHHEDEYRRFGSILSLIGGFYVLGGTLAFTFNSFWKYGTETLRNGMMENMLINPSIWIIIILLILGLLSSLLGIKRGTRGDRLRDASFLLGVLPICLLLKYSLYPFTWNRDFNQEGFFLPFPEILYSIGMNLVYLSVVIIMIVAGIQRSRTLTVNIGIFFLAVYLFGKYLAFVFESKMDGAIIFLSGGAVFILIGLLSEIVRRRILGTIGMKDVQTTSNNS